MSKQCPNCQRSISCPWCDGTIKALDEAKALAKLVPELLAACKGLLACSLPTDVSGRAMVERAVAAIAKAEGTPAS